MGDTEQRGVLSELIENPVVRFLDPLDGLHRVWMDHADVAFGYAAN